MGVEAAELRELREANAQLQKTKVRSLVHRTKEWLEKGIPLKALKIWKLRT